MTDKHYTARTKATMNYTNNALERVSTLIISQHEQDIYDALQVIKAHHDGNRAGAIKQAILEYAKMIQGD
ncbi:MAG: hypothetical protein Q4G13_08605 [Moraxella sp.]|nr:hypothetical protein [Moraxella sp.]